MMVMKNSILLFFLLITAFGAFAQKPSWINAQARSASYPEQQYFIGYAYELNTQNKSHEDLLEKLKGFARTDLIQSIQVAIKSVTSMDVENKNGKSSQYLKQASTSLSQANIVGLKYEIYYDTKTKEAFAFCYALKSEVVAYYKNTVSTKITAIQNKIEIAKKAIETGDKKNALKAYFDCMPLFREIEEAQGLLVVLNIKDEISLKEEDSKQLKVDVNKGIFALYSGKSLSLDDVAYFIAYSLKMQTGELQDQVSLDKFLYQDTELPSSFSSRFGSSLEQSLVKETFKLLKTGKAVCVLSGTYWEDGENIKIIAILRNSETSKAIASAECLLSKSWLKSNNIDYIPDNFDKVNKLGRIRITSSVSDLKAKQNQPLSSPVVFTVLEKDDAGVEKPLANAPVAFSYPANGKLTVIKLITNASGSISFNEKLQTSERKMKLVATLDLLQYLAADSMSAFYKKTMKMYALPKAEINVVLGGTAVYFEGSEKKFGYKMDFSLLEPKLKESLSSKGFEFVPSKAAADLVVKIDADARRGSNMEGVCMSFVDANVAITEVSSGSEIFKNSYTNIKGGGSDFDMAAVKAYGNAAKKITEEIVKLMVK